MWVADVFHVGRLEVSVLVPSSLGRQYGPETVSYIVLAFVSYFLGKDSFHSRKGLHNFTHPRTDPVVIMIAVDETGDRILLGRNVRIFLPSFASLL